MSAIYLVNEDYYYYQYQFLLRDVMRKRGLCCRPVSVRPRVRLSRWSIVSRRLKIWLDFFLIPVAPSF